MLQKQILLFLKLHAQTLFSEEVFLSFDICSSLLETAGYCFNFKAEALVLLTGLKLAKDRFLLPLIIEGDSSGVISWAKKDTFFLGRLQTLSRRFLTLVTVPQCLSL